MKIIIKLFLLFQLCAAVSCSSYYSEELTGDINILVLSDVHISNDKEKDNRFKQIIHKINNKELAVDHLIITGDCVSSIYPGDNAEDHLPENNRLLKLQNMLDELKTPYYLVMGNHDYKIDKSKDSDDPFTENEILSMENIWRDITGFEPYYSYEINGWKYIFLNSMRGRYLERNLDLQQLKWLSDEMKTDIPVLLFMHHPIETDSYKIWCKSKDLITAEKEPEFLKILEENKSKVKGIMVGHGHMWVSDKLFDEIKVFETDSFGDAENFTFSILSINSSQNSIAVKKFDDVNKEELKIH